MINTDLISPAVEKLRAAKSVAVITGAGVSAESGIPTFRGSGGLWNQFSIEDLATLEGFRRNPKLVWEWYLWRRNEYGHAQPNPAHYTIAEMEAYYPEFLVITQNIDTLHTKAGSTKLLEIHGNIYKARCTECETVFDNLYTSLPDDLIRCPACHALARPHIVWFGELYDMQMIDQAIAFLAATDVVIVVGTSGMVSTPVYFALEALQHGAYIIDINPEISEVSGHAHCHLQEKAGVALPKLWEAVKNSKESAKVLLLHSKSEER